MKKKHILIINGPNLNLLHRRDKKIYGDVSLEEAEEQCSQLAKQVGIKIEFVQSNNEGEIVDLIQESLDNFDGIIINAGAYTHTSVAIRDALEIFEKPKIELHISNVFKRDEFRRHSYLSEVVDAVVSGLGIYGYSVALLAMNHLIK